MQLKNRLVKADFWTDTGLAKELPAMGRMMYQGLWQLAEDKYKRTEVEIIEEYLLIKKNNRENITYITVSDNGNLDTTNVSDSKSTQSIRIKDKDKNKDKNKEHCPAEKKQDIPYKEIVKYLNSRTGSQYKSTTNKTQKLIKARWNEGFRLDDFKTAIDKKCVEWIGDEEMEKYLRPPTLFSNKFESYLNQLSVKNSSQSKEDRQNDMIKDLYQEYKEEEEEE